MEKEPVTGGLADSIRLIEVSEKSLIEIVSRLLRQLFGLYFRVNVLSFGAEVTSSWDGIIGTFGYNLLVVTSLASKLLNFI